MPLLINILAIFIWFLHWHGYFKSLNLKVFLISFLALSLFLWLQIKGLEFGTIYFSISTSIIGLLYLVESKHSFKDQINVNKHLSKRDHSNIDKVSKEANNKNEYISSKLNIHQHVSLILRSIINLLLMVLVPFCAAASISLLLPTVFGIQNVNILVLSLFVFLISWSLLLTWIYMKEKRTMALCLLLLASIATFSTIYITAIHATNISTTTTLVTESPISNSLSINSLDD